MYVPHRDEGSTARQTSAGLCLEAVRYVLRTPCCWLLQLCVGICVIVHTCSHTTSYILPSCLYEVHRKSASPCTFRTFTLSALAIHLLRTCLPDRWSSNQIQSAHCYSQKTRYAHLPATARSHISISDRPWALFFPIVVIMKLANQWLRYKPTYDLPPFPGTMGVRDKLVDGAVTPMSCPSLIVATHHMQSSYSVHVVDVKLRCRNERKYETCTSCFCTAAAPDGHLLVQYKV